MSYPVSFPMLLVSFVLVRGLSWRMNCGFNKMRRSSILECVFDSSLQVETAPTTICLQLNLTDLTSSVNCSHRPNYSRICIMFTGVDTRSCLLGGARSDGSDA